jgi:hypothetical protein
VIAALYTLSTLAMLLAWAVARRRSEHRAVALLLTFGLASDAVRRLLWTLVPAPPLGAPPLQGLARVVGHLEHALFLGWPFGIAAVAVWTLARRQPRLVALLYLAAVACLVVSYPTIRGEGLRRFYLAAELTSLLISLAALLPALGRIRQGEQPATVSMVSAGLLIAGHFAAVVFGPYRFGLFGAWNLAQTSYLVIYGAQVALHGAWLWKQRSRSS